MNASRLLEILCSLTMQVAVVVGVTQFLGQRYFRDDRDRDRLWSGCLLALLLVPICDFCLPHLRMLPVPAVLVDPDVGLRLEAHAGAIMWIVRLWMAGALLMLGRIVVGSLRAAWLLGRSAPIDAARLPVPWGTLAVSCDRVAFERSKAMQGRAGRDARPIRFRATTETLSPFCWQLHRPTIVLPETVLSFPPDEIAAVIRHEAAHLSFAHPLRLFVQRVAEASLWFHPAVWWAGKKSNAAREFACDQLAAPTAETAAALLRSMLRLAELGCGPARSSLANAATGTSASLLAERARKLSQSVVAPVDSARRTGFPLAPAIVAVAAVLLLWIPMDVCASSRSLWSPWPVWSARALQSLGISARDYEIDGHRLRTDGRAM
ncbi:MAG TPA: M56 family metallopeptidase [Pirellulales bacterium]|jgi:Zn-dependent protease with chaperone function